MQDRLEVLKRQGLMRQLRCLESKGATLVYEGKTYLNLSSNDYLGISARLDWQQEFLQTLSPEQFWMSSTSSRLLTGHETSGELLEKYLASLYGKSCLLYNSGYHANSGILPALVEKGDLVLADKLVHASIIDGLQLCDCDWRRFKHNDLDDLERLLQQAQGKYNRIYIVTESVFSMDGDVADLPALVALKHAYNARLYVDEAHAFGVFGDKGLGLTEARGLIADVDFIMCTLGKAAASEGAFVICSEDDRQWLINKCRTLIFTTAAAPISLAWSHFVIKRMVQMKQERDELKAMVRLFREKLCRYDLQGCTHIVPMLVGENSPCSALAEKLQQAGLWVMPIRYPTIPAGQARIRFSLTAAHTQEQVEQTYEAVLAYA